MFALINDGSNYPLGNIFSLAISTPYGYPFIGMYVLRNCPTRLTPGLCRRNG